jgi:hypothetical protein
MKYERSWCVALGLVAGGLVGCSSAPTNTGYEGTWVRGEAVRSTLEIARSGESYLVRWTLTTANNDRTVLCDWDGVCVETVKGEKQADFTLTPSVDPESENLMIELRGTAYNPVETEMHFLDELVVRPRGMRLVAHTLVEGEQTFVRGEGQPRRIFDKLKDSVEEPPESAE